MLTIPISSSDAASPIDQAPRSQPAACVMLADGTQLSLAGMSRADLAQLQWEQEQRLARAIIVTPKYSRERELVTQQAYDTICTILSALQANGMPLNMGVDNRYVRLVLELLNRQVARGIGRPRLFEIGYGSGFLLKEISEYGFPVGGVEVSSVMRDQALNLLGERHVGQLFFGSFLQMDPGLLPERPSLVYWNDVFEHICPDEISDYLTRIHQLLQPGGLLVTITPNWLLRPSDVTGDFCPPRTEARGLHLKEYRLAEVTRLLKQAGFRRVSSPLLVSRHRIFLCGNGLRLFKQSCEPLIDKLPIKTAHLACRGLGLSYTIATK